MPPEDVVRPWMLLTGTNVNILGSSYGSITFTVKDPSNPDSYWSAVSGDRSGTARFMLKSSSEIKKAAAEITAGAATQDEKLRKLYAFCQNEIKNITYDTTLTDEDKRKAPQIRSMNDVLKKKSANWFYVNLLFGALASASGFDVRLAYTSDRSEMFFTPKMANENLIHHAGVAVNMGNDDWRYFKPGLPFLPYGMLLWYEEDAYALLVGEKEYLWRKTPMTDHTGSNTKRSGKFRLLEDGTLEGDVTVESVGHPALSYRMDKYDESPNKREEDLKAELTGRVSTAEVSAISVENLNDPSKPLVQRYKIKIPSYAQKTGKRLFLQPGFFEYGTNPLFSSASRKYDIFFRYPWSETDAIEINLPKGYSLDSADAPDKLADRQNIGSIDVKIGVGESGDFLKYDRSFHFGGGGHVLFPLQAYSTLKTMFDAFHKKDTHMITLKQN